MGGSVCMRLWVVSEYAPQDDVRTAVRAFLEEVSPPAEVRRVMDTPDGFDGTVLFEVNGEATGLTRRALPTMDQTRRLARIELVGTRGRLVGAKGGGWAILSRALDLTVIALAAEQVGGAQRCLEMAVAHAK